MKPIHAVITSLIISIGVCLYVFLVTKETKAVYVNMEEVFQGFEGTKEYQKELELMQKQHKKVLDSLRLDVLAFENERGQEDSLVIKKSNYYNSVYQELINNESEATAEFDSKIWNQINQYMKEFGKGKGYNFIHGSKGDGNLMYAKDELNVSEEFIIYMNKKYSGE